MAALHYLTEALYKSLCYHRKLDDPSHAKRITLPYGRPKNGNEGDELLPFPPDDPERGELFPERVKALLRRHVVERCIYGVDINPLAVELARVSLWVETLDPDLPFSFLDHKIKVGNSLVGCWLDRVEDYPLKAWEREGGDGKDGPRTQRIEEFLKGEKIGKKRSGDGRIKKEMREVIESRFSKQIELFPEQHVTADQVVAEARSEYEKLHSLPIADPDERERFYREHVQASPALRRLKQAMDEWCAVWFWPSDEESLQRVPTPLSFHQPSEQAVKTIEQLATKLKFFHWELEFPDVFTPQRSGFDAMNGNPPWDVMKPNSQEFFTEFDPLFRTYGRVHSLRRMTELFGAMTGVEEAWMDYCGNFKGFANWIANIGDPFGAGKRVIVKGGQLHTCKPSGIRNVENESAIRRPATSIQVISKGESLHIVCFLELSYYITAAGGAVGMIVPSGIYSDSWTQPLRRLFLTNATWEWLCGLINWERIFNIYYRFKFAVLVVRKVTPSPDHAVHIAFGRYKVSDWENVETVAFTIPCRTISGIQSREPSPARDQDGARPRQIARRCIGARFASVTKCRGGTYT